MRDDPFAKLSGLDQKLFMPPPPTQAAGEEKAKGAKKQRVEATEERPDGRSEHPGFQPTSQRTKEGALGRSFELPKERLTERHPYDFYKDQVLWLNKVKVEIQEKYGRKVTASAIVQLALDLFIRDYRKRGERSSLITDLVLNQLAMGRPDQSSGEPPAEPTSERPPEES